MRGVCAQCCEDRKAPVGGFAKPGVEPLPGFDDVLNGAILVIRRELDTVPRGTDLRALSAPPECAPLRGILDGACERAHRRAGYWNPKRS